MCLGVPMKIIARDSIYTARAETLGVERAVRTDLVPEVKPGDFVLVHAGFVVEIIDQWEAEERIRLLEQALREDTAL